MAIYMIGGWIAGIALISTQSWVSLNEEAVMLWLLTEYQLSVGASGDLISTMDCCL
jgi:hypothetical protein